MLGNSGRPEPTQVAEAVRAYLQSMFDLGKASAGDKTLLDAVIPFTESLESETAAGRDLSSAWDSAVVAAVAGADATAALSPKVGRARPLAARSVGTADPGAVSFGICVRAIGGVLAEEGCE